MYNVLRVEKAGPAILQSPAMLPIFGSHLLSSQESHQISSLGSGSLSWQSTRVDPSEPLDLRQRRSSCPFPVVESFSLSSSIVTGEGYDISSNVESNGEQHLLGYHSMEAITPRRDFSGSEASAESKDQNGFFAVCWQNPVAWIYVLFAKVVGRFSNA